MLNWNSTRFPGAAPKKRLAGSIFKLTFSLKTLISKPSRPPNLDNIRWFEIHLLNGSTFCAAAFSSYPGIKKFPKMIYLLNRNILMHQTHHDSNSTFPHQRRFSYKPTLSQLNAKDNDQLRIKKRLATENNMTL